MEEEISYSTVVFSNGAPPPKEKKEDTAVYSKVKPKVPVATGPAGGEAAAHTHFCVLAVCLGIVCVLLVASVSAITYTSVVLNKQQAKLINLTAANQQLITERSTLERETEELSRVTDSLNRTLRVIMNFNTFPVNEYCPQKKCQPCQTGWILFQEQCYLFYNEKAPWMTWEESRKYCQNTAADLVVIETLQEQEFISNHTEFYYDHFHGYWLGLYESDGKNWNWIDGRNDTLGFWAKGMLGNHGRCGLMIPDRNLKANWDPADCVMANKFICESEGLIWSP
ncbi:C-type lectin domain family 1 member B-like [Pempheris klunzingeri]|uniref:C-type lectin domain family 1 member B-like n=1 Tax=Pempheris klunzingeri TaxID=3127111 RepID=UPI003980772E